MAHCHNTASQVSETGWPRLLGHPLCPPRQGDAPEAGGYPTRSPSPFPVYDTHAAMLRLPFPDSTAQRHRRGRGSRDTPFAHLGKAMPPRRVVISSGRHARAPRRSTTSSSVNAIRSRFTPRAPSTSTMLLHHQSKKGFALSRKAACIYRGHVRVTCQSSLDPVSQLSCPQSKTVSTTAETQVYNRKLGKAFDKSQGLHESRCSGYHAPRGAHGCLGPLDNIQNAHTTQTVLAHAILFRRHS